MTTSDAPSWRSRNDVSSSRAVPGSSSERGRGRSHSGRSRSGRGRSQTTHERESDAREWRRSSLSSNVNPPQHHQQRQQQSDGSATLAPPAVSSTLQPVRGTCMQMCSRAEVLERTRTLEISRFEQPLTGLFTRADGDVFALAVKKYRRAAAGQIETDATELRPPQVLQATLTHLFTRVLRWPQSGFDWQFGSASESDSNHHTIDVERSFLSLYHFISDRVRSIRKDLTIQRIADATATSALLQTARFYILASLRSKQLLLASSTTTSDWSDVLNDQQLASALAQLHTLASSSDTDPLLHEAVAYDILLHADDPSAVTWLLRRVSQSTCTSAPVTRCLLLFTALQTLDVHRFRRFWQTATAIEQSLALRHAPTLWVAGVARLHRSYLKVDAIALETIATWLVLPNAEAAKTLCQALQIHVERSEDDAASSSIGAVRFKVTSMCLKQSLEDATRTALLAAAADQIFTRAILDKHTSASDLVLFNGASASV